MANRDSAASPVCFEALAGSWYLCMWVGLFTLGACLVTSAQVPVHQEPLHRVAFANENLRVLNVNYRSGEISQDHIHAHDIAIVCISGCELRTRLVGGPWGRGLRRRLVAPERPR